MVVFLPGQISAKQVGRHLGTRWPANGMCRPHGGLSNCKLSNSYARLLRCTGAGPSLKIDYQLHSVGAASLPLHRTPPPPHNRRPTPWGPSGHPQVRHGVQGAAQGAAPGGVPGEGGPRESHGGFRAGVRLGRQARARRWGSPGVPRHCESKCFSVGVLGDIFHTGRRPRRRRHADTHAFSLAVLSLPPRRHPCCSAPRSPPPGGIQTSVEQ